MFFTRSVLASATLLSFSASTHGWVLHRSADEHAEIKRVAHGQPQDGWSWNNLFKKRQDNNDVVLDCPNNQFASLLDNNPDNSVESFCNDWLNLAPATVVSEVTPTVTLTTSALTTTTQTTTDRVQITTTVIETATFTPTAAVHRRMVAAAAAQIQSIASSIVESVIASGTPTSSVPVDSKPSNRVAAEQGLATACSCKMVQPTATVTSLYTVPAVTSTVGVRVIRVVRTTETITYTQTTSVRASVADAAATSASSASSSTDAASSSADAEGSSSASASASASDASDESAASSSSSEAVISSSAPASDAEEPSSSPAITAAPVASTTASGGNSTSTVDGSLAGVPVVTALPFSCDQNDTAKNVDQVVGGIRLGYSVYCNTGFVTADRIGNPIDVESATSCAAQCSLLNAQSGQDTCQSALFTPYPDGRRGGTCDILSAAEASSVETAPSPGSVAIVHTGTFANGDECAALNASSVSIDTSALVASITSGGVVLSTPGLVTQTSDSGEFQTYVSANSTDAQGYVHWSWYQVYASSMSWWAVYQTSWACSATITRTIEQQATTIIEGSTITSVYVTTIIANGFTTIISGDVTRTIAGGGGVAGPTFVSASTTEGEAGVTTFFSTATQTSTGTDGIVTPAPSSSVVGGEGNVTVIEVFTTFFSTGTEGVIAPSVSVPLVASGNESIAVETIVSSGATVITLSGSGATLVSTGADGIITPSVAPSVETIVSSGATIVTVGGSNSTSTSTGDDGVISPSASASESSAVVSSASTSSEGDWDNEGPYGPKFSTVVVVSSGVYTSTSTGAGGVETPTVVTALSSETVVVVITNTTVAGNASVVLSTGGNGVVTPTVLTEVITTAVATANFTISGATAVTNSIGTEGVIPPASTLPTPSASISLGGSGNFTDSFVTGFSTSAGDSGVIPPVPTTSAGTPFNPNEGDRTGEFSRSATANSTGASGVMTPSTNITVAIETPSANTTLVLTVPLSTGFTTTVEIPPVNSTLPVTAPPSSTAAPTGNTTSSIPESEADRSGSFSRPVTTSSVPVNTTITVTVPVGTGSVTVGIPVVNSTVQVPEITPSSALPPFSVESASTLVVTATTNVTVSVPTGNVTVVTLIPPTTRPFDNTTAALPTPSGNISSESLVSINWSTVPFFSTGDLSTILPSPTPTGNITIAVETPSASLNSSTIPPSVTIPPVSANSSASLPVQNSTSPFTNSDRDRTGSYSRPVTLSTGTGVSSFSSNATTTPPPFPTGNSTVPLGPTVPANLTTEACPIATEFSFITREIIVTTFTVETVPILPSSCLSSDAAPTFGGNASLPTLPIPSVVESLASVIDSLTAAEPAATSVEVPSVVSEILSVISEVTASATADASSAPVPTLDRFRRSGTLATQDQIAAACADNGNLVLAPELTIQPGNDTEGWFVSSDDPTITVSSITTDNGTVAEFRSPIPGRLVSLTQPLTLCPGTQYELTGLTRQANRRSGCTTQFRIGTDSIFTATPQTSWISRTERFTAGAGPEGASVDLTLVMSCAGFNGASVGADANGYMSGQVGAVSVTADT